MEKKKKKFTSCLSALAIAATLIASRTTLDNSTLVSRYDLYNSNIEKSFDFDENFDTSYENSNLLNLIFDDQNEIIYEDMVPQGITMVEDYVLVSAYDANYMNKSILYFFDKDFNFVKSLNLDNYAHVGSISYDEKHRLLWVAGRYGCVDAYSLSSLIYASSDIKPIYKDVYVGKHLPSYVNPFLNAVSYLTVDGDYLYVGNYSLIDNANLKKYHISIDEDRTLHLKYKATYSMPTKVQGISFYHDNDKDYMFLSRSFGKKYNSVIQIYEFSDDIIDYRGEHSVAIEAPKMLEQVTIDGNDLYVLNESQAKKYYKTKTDTVNKTDVKVLVNKY